MILLPRRGYGADHDKTIRWQRALCVLSSIRVLAGDTRIVDLYSDSPRGAQREMIMKEATKQRRERQCFRPPMSAPSQEEEGLSLILPATSVPLPCARRFLSLQPLSEFLSTFSSANSCACGYPLALTSCAAAAPSYPVHRNSYPCGPSRSQYAPGQSA